MNKAIHKKYSNTIVKYSGCYLVFLFFCVLFFFFIDNKAMFNCNDGLKQQYTVFVYSGNYIKLIFRNFFIDHIFEFPMWDSTIGMGSDPSNICNPLSTPLLSVFSALVPKKYSEFAFDLIVIIRLYLSGLSFLYFVKEKGFEGIKAISGALVYVFSSTTFIVFSQLNFSTVFIMFPLLLLGAEKLWTKKTGILYAVVLTYSFILSYYFTYMMLIHLVIYCIIRFIYEKEHTIKRFVSLLSSFVIHTILSIIIGAGSILPSLLNLAKLSRLKTHYDLSIVDLETVKRFFFYGFSCFQADGDSYIGVSSFAAVAVICLFVSKKKAPVIKWCTSLCLLSFAFPIVGSFFNGFNYSSYRYIFSLILCIAYLITLTFDSIKMFKGMIWCISFIFSIIYGGICFFYKENDWAACSAYSLIATVLLVGLINLIGNHIEHIREKLYLFVIFVSCIIIGYTCIHIEFGSSMMDNGTVYDTVFVDGGMLLKKSVNDSKYRTNVIDEDFSLTIVNSSMAAEVNGFDFYHSNQNQRVESYYTDLAVMSHPLEFSRNGFRGRCYLEIMNASNYIIKADRDETCIRAPYSYNYVKSNGEYSLYKSDMGVSLVYFYDNTISTERFMELDPVLRETNLMYSMVINDPEQKESSIISDVVEIPFEIVGYNGITSDGSKFYVNKEKGYITLKPSTTETGQISMLLSGLRCPETDNWHYRNAVVLLDPDGNPISIDYSAMCTTKDKYYYGNDDVIFSFESISEEVDSIRLYFYNIGEYNLDEIKIYSRPTEKMRQTIDAFYDHADIEDINYNYHGNHLDITATTESDRYLYIAIPYSEGWHATVDGTQVEIINANIAFMAIKLSAGTHSIEMTYATPNLYFGWSVSAVGIILFIGYIVYTKKKKA